MAASIVCVCAGRRAERSRGLLLQPLLVLFTFSYVCLLHITMTELYVPGHLGQTIKVLPK